MSTLVNEVHPARAIGVKVTRAALAVDLDDGRTVMAPIGWYPRLVHGTAREIGNWRFVAGGEGIHWPDLDEDISVEGLLAGHPSGESQQSFQRWLAARERTRSGTRLCASAGVRQVRKACRAAARRGRRG